MAIFTTFCVLQKDLLFCTLLSFAQFCGGGSHNFEFCTLLWGGQKKCQTPRKRNNARHTRRVDADDVMEEASRTQTPIDHAHQLLPVASHW